MPLYFPFLSRSTQLLCPKLPFIPSNHLARFRHSSSRARSRSLVEWTPELDSHITQLRLHGHTWKHIGESLHLPAITCYRRYRACIEPELFQFWSPELNRRLSQLALQSKPWNEIAHTLASEQKYPISAMACQQQWYKITQEPVRQHRKTLAVAMTNFRRKDKDLLERHVPKCGGKIGGEGSTLRSDGEPLDWKELAREVFGYRFTPEQLQFKHIQLLTERRRWTRKQEMTLIDLIMQQRVSRDGLDEQVWHEAAQHLKFHSPEDCKNRWQQLQGYLIRKYQISKAGHHWAEGEILAYWASWRRYGNDWDRIAEAVRLTRQGNISTGTNSVPYQDHSSSSLKTPKDCRDDFQFLVALSVSRGDHLEKVLGKLAHNISGRPRSHHWTKEQLDRLKGAASLEYKPCQTSPSDADIDWMAVAKRVGGGVTESQCQYRWATYQSPSTAPGMTRVGRWDQTEVLALQRALHDLHLLGSTYQLPPRFPKFVQQEYSLQRKASAIRTKAKKLLERHVLRYQEDDIRRGMKALISLQDIARAEGNSTPNKHSGHLNTSLRTESDLVGPRSFQEDGDVGALSESLSTDKIMYSDDDPDDDSDLGTVHPTMFVAPGILKTEVPRNVSTSGSKRQRRVVFTWQTGDVEKLERLVKKYGQSSLGWRQIAQEMSIPVLKCKDKWRRSFGDTLYE